ncbi:hypothetical protein [Jiangella endophytica]|uniref:hypothetical protein n=1 Tax=Jiangella endophytica TaxID=1623398 RepID=UPI000E34DA95|nr:hypothetical protein [Jiangella endophytica]
MAYTTESLLDIMEPASFAERWRLEVISSRRLSGEVKVVLLLLYEAMSDEGTVSVSEEDLVTILRRNRSKVVTSISKAVKAGYLVRVVKGQAWKRAVYQAAIPEEDGR